VVGKGYVCAFAMLALHPMRYMNLTDRQWAMVLAALWLLLTLPALGLTPLFDYDETIYAQTAVDMMRLGQWVVPTANGIDFFEKPPFTYYLMDIGFSLFGQNAFAARLPSALFTLMTAFLLFRFGERRGDARMGLMAAAIFLSMFEVGLLAHAAILDAVLNFFIVATLLYYWHWLESDRYSDALLCAAMMGLAVAIKGPVGAVVPVLVIMLDRLLVADLWATLRRIPWLQALPLFFVCASPWYVMIVWQHGTSFLHEFIWVHNIGRALHPMQGHGGGWHYYLVVFAVSSLPWLFWLPWLLRHWDRRQAPLIRLALLWIAVVVVLFTFAQTKLPHYISCIYPALALALAAAWRAKQHDVPHYVRYATACLFAPVALALLFFPWLYAQLPAYIHHPRALAVVEQAITPSWSISIAGGILLLATVALVVWRKHLLWLFVVFGVLLQSALMLPLASFAGRVMQGPTMHAAALMRAMPVDVQWFSYQLNAPSLSFYAQRNYHIVLDEVGWQQWQQAQPPKVLIMREESLIHRPTLKAAEVLLHEGGYIMFGVGVKSRE